MVVVFLKKLKIKSNPDTQAEGLFHVAPIDWWNSLPQMAFCFREVEGIYGGEGWLTVVLATEGGRRAGGRAGGSSGFLPTRSINPRWPLCDTGGCLPTWVCSNRSLNADEGDAS